MTPSLNRDDIARRLRELGLRDGDHVLLHSSLSSLGHVHGGAPAVVGAFREVLGEEGTLVVPIFGALGVITEVVRELPDAVRSIHPKAAVAAVGGRAEHICDDHWRADLAHGPETPYTRLADMGGWVCLLGVDQDRNTTLHGVEETLRLPYLEGTEDVTFDTPEGRQRRSWPFFPGPHRNFIGLDARLRASGKMTIGQIGNAVVRLIRSADLLEVIGAAAAADPAFALCDNPNCADCVAQRAALRRDRFADESFRLAGAASSAGRYAAEIADNCRAAGVGAVELDQLRGQPLDMLDTGTVERAIAMLRDEDLRVSALRFAAAPASVRQAIQVAAEQGVPRLVLPLGPEAERQARRALAAKLDISFCNRALASDVAARAMAALRRALPEVCFTFSPAAFARAGEKPFLHSFKTKLCHWLDQLDIQDATFAGKPTALAHGNAEIKELVSILRCRSFAGHFVLRGLGPLADQARQFADLLERM